MTHDIPLPNALKPPSQLATLGEFAWPLEALCYGFDGWQLVNAPRGEGRPVVLLPGYGTGEWSMRPLEIWLRHLGYRASDWGLGHNKGRIGHDVRRFAARAARQVAIDNKPLTLIGWSLGGVIARETAREYPHLVREIITLGSPIIGGPQHTALGGSFAEVDFDAYERAVHERNLRGLSQPLTVIYSARDGIVGPDIAIDIYNPHARNVKVDSTHMGLGINPRVWRIIADTLA